MAQLVRHQVTVYPVQSRIESLNIHLPRRIRSLFWALSRRFAVYRGASFLQRLFVGEVLGGEFHNANVGRSGSFRVRYQNVIALPELVRQLMAYQFDFHTLMDRLNHVETSLLPNRPW